MSTLRAHLSSTRSRCPAPHGRVQVRRQKIQSDERLSRVASTMQTFAGGHHATAVPPPGGGSRPFHGTVAHDRRAKCSDGATRFSPACANRAHDSPPIAGALGTLRGGILVATQPSRDANVDRSFDRRVAPLSVPINAASHASAAGISVRGQVAGGGAAPEQTVHARRSNPAF